MMLKILQGATVTVFLAVVFIGVLFLFTTPEKMESYGQFIGIVVPLFIAEVIPAFLGKPLKDYIQSKKDK